ncbi:hypothetical protein JOC73_002161 [Alkaliphilus hydrothermalis]|uniref:Uncharacterized protein n=1 Tax=Alkaliphilus hydrothermalis TaxID=1482730 RepID=A0ABS2NRY5_9FIRM|nr:hypothetical protein [Alkaliphilus hydrothermalis]
MDMSSFVDIFLYLLKKLKIFDIILILVDNFYEFIHILHIYAQYVDIVVHNLKVTQIFNKYVFDFGVFFCV